MTACEDLATKAELQELRDQLNAVLGEKEEGGTETLFEKGKDSGVVQGSAGLTLLGLTKTRAASSIQDIIMSNASNGADWKGFTKQGTQILAKTGKGATKALPVVTNVAGAAGTGAAGATAVGGVAIGAAAMVSVLMSLVSIAMSLGLNIATVKVLDKRIDAESKGTKFQLDALNGSMLRLYEKNQEDIDAVNAELAENQVLVETNRQTLEIVKTEIIEAENVNSELIDEISKIQATISDVQAQNDELRQLVQENNIEYNETTAKLEDFISSVDAKIAEAKAIAETQQKQISDLNTEIEDMELEIFLTNGRIDIVQNTVTILQNDFDTLRADLEPTIKLNEIRSKLNSAKLILLQNKTVASGGGGSLPSVNTGVIAGQNGLLELASGLSGSAIAIEPVTSADLLNNSNKFQNQLDQLLPGIGTSEVEQQLFAHLR